MSDQNQAASELEGPACLLCGRADDNPDVFGRSAWCDRVRIHKFCLMFAQVLFREESQEEKGLLVSYRDLIRAVQQAEQEQCFVCGERGATIRCAQSGCARSFHLPCATEGECVTQFFGEHRSFCGEHRPRQAAMAASAEDSECVICLENVGDSTSYHTLACPVCTHAWFHRGCIQQCALSVGSTAFRCPSCQNDSRFCTEMASLGIRIPERLVSFCQTTRMRKRGASSRRS
ncbi:PHD finger protein 7-like [Cyrtonyx montezumae]|uniref:PHD finger protein 7-like n=1 Tax=Cyrtonyx montezumae TaxID=9017 RepID=UPI0032DB510B